MPTDVKDVFQAAVDKKPAEFAQGFDGLMKDKIAKLVQDRRLELASSLFGAPEGLEDEEPQQPDQEGVDNNGQDPEENPQG